MIRLYLHMVACSLIFFLFQIGTANAEGDGSTSARPSSTGLDIRRIHSIAGIWLFRPGDDPKWSRPGESIAGWQPSSIPGRWRNGGYPEHGQMGWYRRVVELDTQIPNYKELSGHLGVQIGKVHSAYEVYADGVLVGRVGSLPPNGRVQYDRIGVYRLPLAAVSDDGRITLTLRVWAGETANIPEWRGGAPEGAFLIGDYTQLMRSQLQSEIPALLLSTVLMAFGIFHLYLFMRNRALTPYLWFSLMAIAVSVYGLVVSQWRYYFELPFELLEKIEFAGAYLLPALGIQLTWAVLGLAIPPVLRCYQYLFVALALSIVVLPGLYPLYHTLFWFQWLTLPILLIVPMVVFYRAWNGSSEARTVAIGVAIFAATGINDILIDQLHTGGPRLVPIGFLAVLASMAVSLANRFSGMLNHLEEEVKDRTLAWEEANRALALRAISDPLTGLLNRRGFIEHVEQEIAREARTARGFSLVLADIDKFKQFNDRFGHACGDAVLIAVANLFHANLRNVDRLARWGGEEFLILLPETDARGAQRLAEKLRLAIAEHRIVHEGETLSITLTFGVAEHRKGESLDHCLSRADKALYQGKVGGRNRVVLAGASHLQVVT